MIPIFGGSLLQEVGRFTPHHTLGEQVSTSPNTSGSSDVGTSLYLGWLNTQVCFFVFILPLIWNPLYRLAIVLQIEAVATQFGGEGGAGRKWERKYFKYLKMLKI